MVMGTAVLSAGIVSPNLFSTVVSRLLTSADPTQLALHLHDTRGTALVNVFAAMELGIACFDSAAGGLGGCPFAPGAAGNLATEDLVYLLDGLGISTGIDLARLRLASGLIADALGRKLPSRVLAAAPWPHAGRA